MAFLDLKENSMTNSLSYLPVTAFVNYSPKWRFRKLSTRAGTLHSQAFIKPIEDTTIYKNSTDAPCVCKNFEIKISEIQMASLDYNLEKKGNKNRFVPSRLQ